MAEAGTKHSGTGPQALALLARGQKRLTALPEAKRNRLLISGVMMVGVIAGVLWYVNRPDWRVLFSGLEARDVQTVSQELGAAGISFRTTPDSSGLEVPAELLDKARMEVAGKGMPQTGRLGFELFDKPNWVGSEFDEKVNYQRALEGELEHTIGTLEAVRSARVHLVWPAESMFSQEAKVAKASVVLKLKHPELGADQVDAIRRLVSGSVENLTAENVTLVDADGHASLKSRGQGADEKDAEQGMEAKLVALLEPLIGPGNVQAVVNASYDDASEVRTDEVYDPSQTATLSMEKTEQTSGPTARASGVPGTASNTPAAAPVGAVQGSAAAAAPGLPPLLQTPTKESLPVFPERGAGQTQTMHQESGSYGVTKHVIRREDAPGRLKRVSVAVLVNDRMLLEGSGSTQRVSWKPRSSEEMHRLEGLAQAAVGYDLKRGDQVMVENVSFNANATEGSSAAAGKIAEQAESLLRSQPGLLRAGVLGVLGLLMVTMVMRPVAQQMVAVLKEPAGLAAGAKHGLGAGDPTAQPIDVARSGLPEPRREIPMEVVVQTIQKKPAQSKRLLENWINEPQEIG